MKKIFRSNFAFTLCTIACLLVMSAVAYPQDSPPTLNRLAFTGAGYYEGAQAKGVAGFVVQLGDDSDIYNITTMTAGTAPKGLGNVVFAGKDFQADYSTGLMYRVVNIKGFDIFGLGDMGLQQTGELSSFKFQAGGGVHRFIYKDSVGIAFFGTWKLAEDPVSRTMKWKVNPAVALTFPF